jgi:hypothetical protein
LSALEIEADSDVGA